jgi:hypothetical protein
VETDNNIPQTQFEVTPSVEQSPIDQPQTPVLPKKRKLNYWMISTLVLFFLMVIGGLLYFNLSKAPTTISDEETDFSTNSQLLGKLAFIRGNNLWLLSGGIEKQITLDAISTENRYTDGLPSFWYSDPQISPDGNKITFLKTTKTYVRALMVSDTNGKNIRQIADDVEWTMPIVQWSKDSNQIYYPSGGTELITVKSINVTTEQKTEHGQFVLGSGCGGGSSDPADGVSEVENITSVGGGVQVFDLSPNDDFIVHTILCTGSGLGILNLSTKQDKTIDDTAMRAVVSPDGKSIASVSGKNVVIFDNTGNIQKTYSVSDNPLILLWTADSKTIYYSSSKLFKSLNFSDELALDTLGSSPNSFMENVSTLWKLSLDSGKDEKIIDFDAHNIKPFFVTGQKLLLVVVENATALFNYINEQKTSDDSAKYYPGVKLAEVDLSSLSSTVIADDVQESFFLP